jgi:hypothetical protein
VVTDHRLVLAVSKEATTLYDQMQFQGEPTSFAWVLPIRGEAKVGLSSVGLFSALDALTATELTSPDPGCPKPLECNKGSVGCGAGDSLGSAPGDFGAVGGRGLSDGGVVVEKREVVGPYEAVQLNVQGGNGGVLIKWLADNGFAMPKEAEPILDAHVKEGSNFLALKFVPGAGVSAMRPVRVTTKGAAASVPLRAAAVGAGEKVGMTLWVVGEGRYEPEGLPVFTVEGKELFWDWSNGSTNFAEVRARKTLETEGRGWELESSIDLSKSEVEANIKDAAGDYGMGPARDGGSSGGSDSGDALEAGNAGDAKADDLRALWGGIPEPKVRVTRLRADLSKRGLEKDLVLKASAVQSEVPKIREVIEARGEPSCAIHRRCESQEVKLPRSQAKALQDQWVAEEGSGCTAVRGPTGVRFGNPGMVAAVLTSLGALMGRRFVRRSSRSSSRSQDRTARGGG